MGGCIAVQIQSARLAPLDHKETRAKIRDIMVHRNYYVDDVSTVIAEYPPECYSPMAIERLSLSIEACPHMADLLNADRTQAEIHGGAVPMIRIRMRSNFEAGRVVRLVYRWNAKHKMWMVGRNFTDDEVLKYYEDVKNSGS